MLSIEIYIIFSLHSDESELSCGAECAPLRAERADNNKQLITSNEEDEVHRSPPPSVPRVSDIDHTHNKKTIEIQSSTIYDEDHRSPLFLVYSDIDHTQLLRFKTQLYEDPSVPSVPRVFSRRAR